MVLFAEIDLVHPPVPGDLLRRPLDQDFALHEHGSDLDQALLAVGQVEDANARVLGETERGKQFHALLAHVTVGACRTQHAPRDAAALGHRERHVVEHRKAAEEGVDLERSAQPALHPPRLSHGGDVLPAEHDRAGGGRQRPGEHVDEGGFPGAVRTDQGMARASLQPEIDVVRHGERAEALAQSTRLESGGGAHGLLRSFTRIPSRIPRIPSRANTTTSTSIVPMPKYQYSGNCLASKSCAIRYTTGPTNAP